MSMNTAVAESPVAKPAVPDAMMDAVIRAMDSAAIVASAIVAAAVVESINAASEEEECSHGEKNMA